MTQQTPYRIVLSVVLLLGVISCNPFRPPAPTPTPSPTPISIPTVQPDVAPTPTPELTAGDIAGRSAERMLAVQSLHFSIEPSGAPVALDPYIDSPIPIALKGVEGDMVRPDKMHAQINVSVLGFATDIGLIHYEGDTYMSNPLSGEWETLPAEVGAMVNPSFLFDPDQGLPTLLPSMELDDLGVEDIQGQPAYHLNVADMGDLRMLGGEADGSVSVDVWIDVQSFLLRQAVVTQPTTDSDQPTVWHIDLSDFDQPVNIQPPSLK